MATRIGVVYEGVGNVIQRATVCRSRGSRTIVSVVGNDYPVEGGHGGPRATVVSTIVLRHHLVVLLHVVAAVVVHVVVIVGAGDGHDSKVCSRDASIADGVYRREGAVAIRRVTRGTPIIHTCRRCWPRRVLVLRTVELLLLLWGWGWVGRSSRLVSSPLTLSA